MLRARRTTLLSVAGLAALGLTVAIVSNADHIGPWPYVPRGAAGAAIIFLATGLAAAARLTPVRLQPIWPVFALPAGAVLGSLALTALGFAAVPLEVSTWLVLALGAAAWWRFARGRAPRADLWALVPWVVAAVVAFGMATLPSWRLNETTIFGTNPDSHQVTGSAVLLQEAPAWAVREGTPVNVVPPAWQSRYPIIYVLAASANLTHFDPIFVFPGIAGLMVVIAALGFAALALFAFRLPLGAGPWIAIALPLNALVLHIAWHPYYNQLWGLALLPWAILFGWQLAREASRPAAIAFAGLMLLLAMAYPLAALYPVVTTIGFAWAHGRARPRIPRPRGAPQKLGAAVIGVLLILPLLAGIQKIGNGVRQLLDPRADLWGGDIHEFLPVSDFVGTDFGVAGLLAVMAVGAVAVARLLPRREALALLALLAVSALFDGRLRLSDRGAYMDFKHLGYLGAVVLTFAAVGVVAAILSRRAALVAGGVVLAAAWAFVAVGNVRDEAEATPEQVTADMLRLRDWADALPPDATIRVDVPPSGNQLWVQYMLSERALGSPYPVLNTTYARMPFSVAGDYVLYPRHLPGQQVKRWPHPRHSSGPSLFESHSFILRRLDVPGERYLDRASKTMIQP